MSDQPERRTYTAEEFDTLAEPWAGLGKRDTRGRLSERDELLFTAIRIAANVMRPGVIEAALGSERDYPPHEASVIDDAASIRAALTAPTQETNNGR